MSKKKIGLIVIGLVVILAASGGIYTFARYRSIQQEKSSNDVGSLVARVGKLIQLPQGETPTVATVSDVEKLRQQQFFVNAKNGDRLLIYSGAKKAFLYDPIANIIIDVAPVNFDLTAQVASSAASIPTPTPGVVKISILNGTRVNGLTRTVENKLLGKVGQFSLSGRANTQGVYAETLVVDVSGNLSERASEIAKVLGGNVGLLPPTEQAPVGTEILIIAGEDQAS